MGFYGGYNGYNNNGYLFNHICKFLGQTVTIFTESGGLSGYGFTGVLIKVNCDFVRVVVQQGTPPVCPINFSACNRRNNSRVYDDQRHQPYNSVGSVCDIPICKIVSFCHNSI